MRTSTIVGLLACTALAVSAGTAAAQGQAPKRGGQLKFAVSAEPPNYDCHANSSFAFIHPVRPHYSTLLKFDAPNYFDATRNNDGSVITQLPKSALKQHQYGGSIGGPLAKDKAFFFGSYEGYRLDAGVNFIEGAPSASAWSRAVPASCAPSTSRPRSGRSPRPSRPTPAPTRRGSTTRSRS